MSVQTRKEPPDIRVTFASTEPITSMDVTNQPATEMYLGTAEKFGKQDKNSSK